jgi:nucleotide-binding universal stress UspA family protein
MGMSGLVEGRMKAESILFATDFSPASYAASLYATALAEHFHSVLKLVHVFLPTQSAQEAEARDGIVSEQRRLIQEKLALTTQALTPRGGTAQSILLEGDPSIILPQEAAKSSGTILVLGTHGGNTVARHLIGSVAENTLRRSALPTLTVGEQVATSGKALPFRRMLYATDSSPVAAQAAPWACAFAKSFSSLLEVVSVIDKNAGPSARIIAELDFRTQQELGASPAERCEHFEKLRDVTYSEHAHDEILRRLKEDECDLLVLGIEKKSSLGFADRNSGAFRIIADAPCAVLTITQAATTHHFRAAWTDR